MNLEDHLGDILRKARQAANMPLEAAARAAGLAVEELTALEASGNFNQGPNFTALAPAVGLHPAKLESLAKGWLPAQPDPSLWRELRRVTTTRDGNTVHCYLVWDEVTREAALFDTGWEAQPILDLVSEHDLLLRHLFFTHTHEDHIAALSGIRERFPKVRLHSSSKHAPVDQRNRASDFIHLGSLRIMNRETPGHAEDGMTYVIGTWPEDAPHVAIVGDVIFAGSIGTGFQSWDLLKQKVREKIFTLPVETLICPGHGPFTTVGEEKAHNPFFV